MAKKKKETAPEQEVENSENVENKVTEAAVEEAPEQSPEQSREEKLEAELAAVNDKYLRLYAEFDNYRRRTAKQQLDMQRTASGEAIKTILPVLDDFERAIESNRETDDATALKQGFELIYNKFKVSLEKSGLKEIEAKGEPFNTDLHEAITNIPAPSDDLKGKVVDVVEKGYFLNDHVLRFSKVVVGQ
ncbi:MAG: nucleotide exchange factor GrpE [Cryomorphaceae bacterium]|nr:MAG: nucleotide exchange factor GrpE [Cryomorphaceae bacterium]